MNAAERIKMVKAMEYIARQVNDEQFFYDIWLTYGVADEDIVYGDLSVSEDDINLEYYIKDKPFAELMKDFLWLMRCASENGLVCDGIVSE